MKIETVKLVCFSATHTTEKVVKTIGEQLNVDIVEYDSLINGKIGIYLPLNCLDCDSTTLKIEENVIVKRTKKTTFFKE